MRSLISAGIPRRYRPIAQASVLIALTGYLVVYPLIRLQTMALSDGASAYRRAMDVPGMGQAIMTTIYLALGSVAIAMALGVGLAWASTRLPHRLRILGSIPLLPMVIPAVANVTGWVFLFAPRTGYLNSALRATPFFGGDTGPVDIYSVPWIIAVTGFGLTSFVYVFVRSGLANVSAELEEAARISGLPQRKVFFTITLPLLRPVLVYGGAIALLLGLGQFTAPLLLGSRNNVSVVTTEVFRWTNEVPVDYGIAAALGSPLLVFGIFMVIGQRVLLGDQSRFVTHGGKAFRGERSASPWAAIPLIIYGIVAVVLPLLAITFVALSPFYSPDISLSNLTVDHFQTLFDTPHLAGAIRTSVISSLGAVAVLIPLGYGITALLHAHPDRALVRVLDVIINLPLGVPAVVFGAGFLFVYTRAPLVLYGTRWVIILVYIAIMLPFVVRILLAARIALGSQYTEAARTCGAGPSLISRDIIFPLMRQSVAGAAALMFVMLTHEFTASLLVRSTRTQVMGTQLYALWTNGSYPQVAAMAVVMCLITSLGVAFALIFGRGSASIEQL